MIHVHGLLGDPSPKTQAIADRADLVIGSARALDALGVPEDKRLVLGPLGPALERIKQSPGETLIVASGDPGFYGIVRRLRQEGHELKVQPAVSSIAQAFAEVALPWDDAVIVSAHGRPGPGAARAARRHKKVAVLTSAKYGIRELAAEVEDRTFVLAERLGQDDQRVRVLTTDQAREVEDVLEPNVVLVLAAPPDDSAMFTATEVERSGIGQLVNSPAAERHADQIDQILGVKTKRYVGPATRFIEDAWRECDLIVSHLALGATTRLIASLLDDKTTDPGVVVVDEAARFVVPLVGGHAGGANELARQLAAGLGATPVLTTATDATNLPALDTLGWHYEGAVAAVTQAIINGDPVSVERTQPWPLPPFPENVSPEASDANARIVVTDEAVEADKATVVLHPPSLVAGMGCNKGTSADELRSLLERTLADAGLSIHSLTAITTVDLKAGELGLIQLTHQLGIPLLDFPADVLASQDVPNPSEAVAGHVGTPSVAEASVLARGAELIVGKQRTSEATCAIGRLPARGKLSVVGLGPGSRDLLTERAQQAIRNATFIVGYGPYVKQIRDLVRPGARFMVSKMGTEQQRTSAAIEAARNGENVALVSGGDPAIYALASPALEQGTEGIDVEVIPGVTASLAVSAILGAALGHDHVTISLSDLHTDWESIENRLRAASAGDFVTVLYNPRSRTRTWQLPRALELLGEHRAASTPVAVVENAERPRQSVKTSTLGEFDPEWVNMSSLVVVGSSTTKYVPTGSGEQLMVTPRDYHWMAEATKEQE